MPPTELVSGLTVDSLSTLKLVFDIFLFGININFGWAATMVRSGLKYLLLGGAVLPHVLSTVLQPTPPMGTKFLSRLRTPTDLFQDSMTGPLSCVD